MPLFDRTVADPIFLMDGTAFLYRAFFTGRSMQRSDGFPTNVIVGLGRLLMRILREENPKYFLFVRDGHGKTFRHGLYPDYKANRSATPEDLVRQIEPAMRLVRALGIPEEVTDGFEADDCMASIASRFSEKNPVVIISGDKDLKQCLAPNVYIWNLAAKDETLMTAGDFEREYGIPPSSWPDVQAIVGDTADNIPGVPGIGEKTAMKIFSCVKSLEEIRGNLESLGLKLAKKLNPYLEEMFTWRELTRLSTDYPRDFTLEDFRISPMNGRELMALREEFELVVLGREMRFMLEENGQGGEIAATVEPKETRRTFQRRTLAEELPQAPRSVALFGDPSDDQGLHVAAEKDEKIEEFYWQGPCEVLFPWLSGAGRIVVPDLKALFRTAGPLAAFLRTHLDQVFDVGLACYLLRPDEGEYGWARLEAHWALPFQDGTLGKAGLALKLSESLVTRHEQSGLTSLFRHLEMPLIPVLSDMEQAGLAIDEGLFRAFLRDVETELEKLTARIFSLAGTTFNLRSSQQLAELLYTRLGLTPPSRTKDGKNSTNQQALEKLASAHPVIPPLLQFRKLEKVRSTYLEPLPHLTDAGGRIHTVFDQKGTATGRLSSHDPNLQNIPARGALGLRMRGCFVAPRGFLLVSSDYSQIELRMLAHMSRDPVMLEAFRNNVDIHTRTAALMYDKPEESITPDERRSAKTINFGLIYGMGAPKLARELKISQAEAKTFIDQYFARLTRLRDFYDEVTEQARSNGFVMTIAGRRRELTDILSANTYLRSQAGRQAVNTVIQGSAADIIKIAMVNAANDPELIAMGARLLLQVHDELLFEVPEARAEECGKRLAFCMEHVEPCGTPLSVPLVADWGFGKSWGEAH
ncbi:MAG: DNA polymerase I [Desulfovibrio sp.]|nr:DNA polymerase I [Desulfovibrio sp.]